MKILFNNLVSLSWSSFAGIVYLFSTIQTANALTFVLDFNDSDQGITSDHSDEEVTDFDVTDYGFATSDFNTVTNSVLEKVESHFYDIPTESNYFGTTTSPIADGKQLDIDFEIGDFGTTPSNRDIDHYFIQIGSEVSGTVNFLGQAGFNYARASDGSGRDFNRGRIIGSVFTDNINSLTNVGTALKTGNLDATTNAIAGTLSHEIAHTLSLLHINKANAETPNDVPPLMGTGSVDLPNIDRISDRSFSFSGFNNQVQVDESDSLEHVHEHDEVVHVHEHDEVAHHGDEAEGPNFALDSLLIEDAAAQSHVEQLVSAVGVRDVAAVPFEFSPGMGLFLVGGTWGVTSLRKKSQLRK